MSQIKAGDLVMVVRPAQCCGADHGMGRPYTVASVDTSVMSCNYCGLLAEVTIAWEGPEGGEPLYRLIRLDPDNLREAERKPEEVKA